MFDHRSYAHNFTTEKFNPEKNSSVNGIRTHDLCNTGGVLFHCFP